MNDYNITDYNKKFSNEQLDIDNIKKHKLMYNIYNNEIIEPLHKFRFIINKVKYDNNFNNFKSITLLLNHKNLSNKNLINFIKDIANYLIIKFNDFFKITKFDFPWIINNNNDYPYIFVFNIDNESCLLNSSSQDISLHQLNKNSIYSSIFEIDYIKIIQNNNNNNNYTLKFIFKIIFLKEDDLINDFKKINFNSINLINNNSINNNSINNNSINNGSINNNHNYNNNFQKNTLHNNNPNIHKNDRNNIPKNNITKMNFTISKDLLINAKNNLKKNNMTLDELDNSQNTIKPNEKPDIIQDINQHIKTLKKVKTTEKSLINHLFNRK